MPSASENAWQEIDDGSGPLDTDSIRRPQMEDASVVYVSMQESGEGWREGGKKRSLRKRTGFGYADVVDGYSPCFARGPGVEGTGCVFNGYGLDFCGCEGDEGREDY